MNKITCEYANAKMLFISANGEVTPCPRILSRWVADSSPIEFHVKGQEWSNNLSRQWDVLYDVTHSNNLHEHDMQEILDNDWFDTIRESHSEEEQECKSCYQWCNTKPTIISDKLASINLKNE